MKFGASKQLVREVKLVENVSSDSAGVQQTPPRTFQWVKVETFENYGKLRFKRPPCMGDPLSGSRQVNGIGPVNNSKDALLFLGEAPGADEERIGDPFVGESGDVLRSLASEAGIFMMSAFVSNVIDRRPPGNDLTTFEAQQSLIAQSDALWSELKLLIENHHVKVVIGLGGTALKALNIPGGITTKRGAVFAMSLERRCEVGPNEPYDFLFIPTYHPAHLLRQGHKQKAGVHVTLSSIMMQDLIKAREILEGKYIRYAERFNLEPTLNDVLTFVEDCIVRYKADPESYVVCDIETLALEPWESFIAMIGFAWTKEDAICVPLRTTGGAEYWREDEKPLILKALRKLFSVCQFAFQNGQFDVAWLYFHEFCTMEIKIAHDTLLLHHVLNPELDHNLEFIASIYAKSATWKEVFKNRGTSILNMDQKVARTYNLRDCTIVNQILPNELAELKELPSKATELYYVEELPMLKEFVLLHLEGLNIDQNRKLRWGDGLVEETWKEYVDSEVSLREKSLRAYLPFIPKAFNFSSDTDMRHFLFGSDNNKYEIAGKLKAAQVEYSTFHDFEGKRLRADRFYLTKKYQLMLERLEIAKLEPIWSPHPKYKGRTTDTGFWQINEQAILTLRSKAISRKEYIQTLVHPKPEHHDELERIESLFVFLELYFQYTEAVIVQSTFTNFKVKPNGKIHPSWKSHGTVTGRPATTGPNVLNWPKEGFGAGVRKLIIPSKGNVIVSADYTMLEVGTMAYCSKEPFFLNVFEGGQNMHDLNATALFLMDSVEKGHPDYSKWFDYRAAAKVFQFAIQYGAGPQEIYQRILVKVPSMKITYGEFEKIYARYLDTKPVYKAWREKMIAEVTETRMIVTPFGRVRRFYNALSDIGKEALNFPCQSSAASIINRAMLRLRKRLRELNLKAKLILQIYDQLVFDCPKDELTRLVPLLHEEMSRPVDWEGSLKVFPIDIEVGPSFGELNSYKEIS